MLRHHFFVEVEPEDCISVACNQPVICPGTHAPHAADKDICSVETKGFVAGQSLAVLELLEQGARCEIDAVSTRVHCRRPDERQCDRDGCHHQPVAVEPAVGDRDGAHDQPELAEIREGLGREGGGTRAHAETGQQPEVQARLEGQHEHQQPGDHQHGRVWSPCHPDAEEESDEEEVLQAQQRLGQFPSLGVAGQEHAEHQGPEIALHVHQFKQPRAPKRQYEPEQHLQLAVAGALQQRRQQGTRRDDGEDQDRRPGRRDLGGRDAEEYDCRDVLDDQDPDGDAPVPGDHVVFLLQQFHREDGAGERQGEGEEQRGCRRQLVEQGKSDGGEQQEHTGRDQCDRGHVGNGDAPDLRAQQLADPKLETDRKQQQGDSEVGHLVEKCAALRTDRTEDEAGDEESDERWQSDLRGQKTEAEGDRNPHRIAVVDGQKKVFHDGPSQPGSRASIR